MMTMNGQEVDLSGLPQAVQNTVHAWLRLQAMAQDRVQHPTLGAEMREAVACVERDMWKEAAQRLGSGEKAE